MKKTGLLTVTLLGCYIQLFAQLSTTYTTRLQTVFDSVCKANNIKGASVAVLVPDIGIWKNSYGESHSGYPITSGMLFGIGSNTKTYTAALMLKLQEMGVLNINDTIGKWITGYPNINGSITIKQLLNHTSGIYDYIDNPHLNDSLIIDFKRVWKPREVLKLVLAPYFSPGTSWHYSNTNYLLAGIIINQVLGQPVNTSYHSLLLSPNALNHTILYAYDSTTDTIARPWSVNFSGLNLEDITAAYGYSNNEFLSIAYTSGGLMATAEDNATFWNLLISGKIIDSISLAQMLQFVPVGKSSGHPIGYGLGVFRYQDFMNGHTIYTHGGTILGYIAENMVDSVTGVCISILTNQDSINNSALNQQVIKALHNVTLTVPPTGLRTLSAEPANIYVYPNPASGYIQISLGSYHPYYVEIYDIYGRRLLQSQYVQSPATIDVNNLSVGNYIIRIFNDHNDHIYSEHLKIVR